MKICLTGCGKMGGALLRGWLAAGAASRVLVLEPQGLPEEFQSNPLVEYIAAPGALSGLQADVFVMAVKPQGMAAVCESLKPFVPADALVLSIAAGQAIIAFQRYFGPDQPIVRAMPNTPAAIGKGISVAVASTSVSQAQRGQAGQLLAAGGLVEWVEDEALLDAVTAVSGSGPGYVFFLIEALAKAGEKAGLSPDFAMTLARQTFIGSAALAEAESVIPAEILRRNVTSPGGTTEAALRILMNGEVQDLFDRAIAAATARGRELSR